MKKIIYLLLIAVFSACSGNSNYERTIADYLQNKDGSKYDLKFKAIDISEQGTITVADSIAFLTTDFRKDKELIIKRIELAKEMSEKMLNNEQSRRSTNQKKIEEYEANIQISNHRIDSLKNLTPNNLKNYENRKSDEVLSKIMRCKYTITLFGTTVEETFDFFLSPDGKKCFDKTRAE